MPLSKATAVGRAVEKVTANLFGFKDIKVLVVGLDGAGKTTIVEQFKHGRYRSTTPTKSYDVRRLTKLNTKFIFWDMGGTTESRQRVWHRHFEGTKAMIFVFDSGSTLARRRLAKLEFCRLIQNQDLKEAIILILANKQDAPHAISASTIREKLADWPSLQNRTWHVVGTCANASTGDGGSGLDEAMAWLTDHYATK